MKRMLSVLLIAVLLLPALCAGAETLTEDTVRARMLAMKDEYYEGRPWTNADFYAWNGGGWYYGGSGCVAFSFILSDAAFGSLPSRYIETIDYGALRAGDILRINNNGHSVIILEKYDDHVVIAEGNFNSSIHWGRTLTKQQVLAADYYVTRYPDSPASDPTTEEPATEAPVTEAPATEAPVTEAPATEAPAVREPFFWINDPTLAHPGSFVYLPLYNYEDSDYIRWTIECDPAYFSPALDLEGFEEIIHALDAEAVIDDTLQLTGEIPEGFYGFFCVWIDPETPEGEYELYTYNLCDAEGNWLFADIWPVIVAKDTPRIPGDADMDGIVTIGDAWLILRWLSEPDCDISLSSADVNGDDTVDQTDAMLILQYDCGWDVVLR